MKKDKEQIIYCIKYDRTKTTQMVLGFKAKFLLHTL